MKESSLKRKKTLWEKEKLLVRSNFSFSNSVFKRLVLHTRKNKDLFVKRLSSGITKKEKINVCSIYATIYFICAKLYVQMLGWNLAWLIISVYLSSLPVAHLSDAPRRRLVVTGDSARIQDESTENSAWFFNVLGV